MPFNGTQQWPIAFNGGLNSKIADFTLDQPNLQVANNIVYNKMGQIDKRNGFTAVSNAILGGGNISSGAAITSFNDELLLMDGQNLYSYNDANNVWINKGEVFSTINNETRVLNTKTSSQTDYDCSTLNGLQLYTYTNRVNGKQSIQYSLIDENTGAFIVANKKVYYHGSYSQVLRVPALNQFNIYYQAGSNILFSNTIDTYRPSVISPLTAVFTDGNPIDGYLVYDTFLANNLASVAYVSVGGITVIIGNTSVLVKSDIAPIRIAATQMSNGQIVVAYALQADDGGGIYVYNIDSSTTTLIDPNLYNGSKVVPNNLAIIEGVDAGSLNISWTNIDTLYGNTQYFIGNTILQGNNTVQPVSYQYKMGLASKPFKMNNNIFINVLSCYNLQATYFTINLSNSFSVVSKHGPQNASNLLGFRFLTLSRCDNDPSNPANFLFAGSRLGPFTSFDNSSETNVGVAGYSIDFNNANSFNNVVSNNNLHIVGGIKKIYDKVSCVEDNFHQFPEMPDGYACDCVLSTGGNLTYNPLTVPNQYQWTVVYEWTDNYGQVQRSQPGVSFTLTTTTTGQSAIITVPTLTLTDKINPNNAVCISIYRTQDSLPIFYKITNDMTPLLNDPTVDTLTFTDTFSDTDIGANENLYTGSQLANTSPPSCSLISLYQNRLFINSTEDQDVLWYSQNKFEQDQYNTIALDWNTSFNEGVDSRLGTTITAIGLMDDTLVIFKETSIFILQGDGPNALDTSGQFNDAQLLVSDTGCNNANSLCFITQTPTYPGGLLFKSDKGIYLFGRDTSITYIGAPVEDYNDLTITSANLQDEKNQVVFTTLEGTCLVYNYYYNTWNTWTQIPAIDSTVWQNKLAILTVDGNVMLEDTTGTVWADTFQNGIVYPVETTITTPFIKAPQGNLQGYWCAYNCTLLGQWKGSHTLQVQIAYDYNPSIVETVLINSTQCVNHWGSLPIWGSLGPWGNNQFAGYQFQINFSNFRCQSIQLTFTDLNPDATQGYTLNGLVLEINPLSGQYRLPLSNQVAAT